jgi:hypothetical protein
MIEPTARDLFVVSHATELGAFQGILQGSKILAGRRIASLTLHGGDNNAIRLILRSKTAAASDDCTGTYVVLGGTGKFERARQRMLLLHTDRSAALGDRIYCAGGHDLLLRALISGRRRSSDHVISPNNTVRQKKRPVRHGVKQASPAVREVIVLPVSTPRECAIHS